MFRNGDDANKIKPLDWINIGLSCFFIIEIGLRTFARGLAALIGIWNILDAISIIVFFLSSVFKDYPGLSSLRVIRLIVILRVAHGAQSVKTVIDTFM